MARKAHAPTVCGRAHRSPTMIAPNERTTDTPFEDILYELRNGVAWITINRPEKLNAFRGTTCDALI